MKLLNTSHRAGSSRRAFTIIEIAICLGIIGFALVAIIAVLPRGLDVQKRNREETIIGEDADVWMNALRNGARGYDDLTNYVLCISNIWTTYKADYSVDRKGVDYYTPSNSLVTSLLTPPPADTVVLTNGARIIGLLSMPKKIPDYVYPPFQSNYVVAYVRAFSGAEVSSVPQTNRIVLGDAFIYRMIVENFAYSPVDTNSYCLDCPATNGLSTLDLVNRTNLARTVWMLQTNSHDFRLRFRWPVLPNGEIPSYGLLTFRSMASGMLLQTNDVATTEQPLFFMQSSIYAQGSTNLP